MTRPRNQVAVGPYTFPTVKRAVEVAKMILRESPRNVPLSDKEYLFARGLLERHPDSVEKTGCGVAAIEVRTIQYGSPGFWIVRTDGTGDDFSYKVALNGAAGQRQQALKAMRQAVRHQTDGFRRDWFAANGDQFERAVCPLTGVSMTPGESEVDHVDVFVRLADRWVQSIGGYDAVVIGGSPDHPGSAMGSERQRIDWSAWHLSNARLRVIHADANRARGADSSAP